MEEKEIKEVIHGLCTCDAAIRDPATSVEERALFTGLKESLKKRVPFLYGQRTMDFPCIFTVENDKE
jgi:hypothetical protein